MSTTQQPPTTPSRSLACDAAEARLLLAAAGSGEAVVIVRAMEPPPCIRWMATKASPAPEPMWMIVGDHYGICWAIDDVPDPEQMVQRGFRCPYGKPGETVDVLEPHAFINQYGVEVEVDDAVGRRHKTTTVYEAGPVAAYRKPDGEMEETDVVAWLPADSMPPWAARLTLTVTATSLARSDAGAWCWEVVAVPTMKGCE